MRPSRHEIEKRLIEANVHVLCRGSYDYDKLISIIVELIDESIPTRDDKDVPIWCAESCPRPWRWVEGNWEYMENGERWTASKEIKFCELCGEPRPEVNDEPKA